MCLMHSEGQGQHREVDLLNAGAVQQQDRRQLVGCTPKAGGPILHSVDPDC